MQTLAGVAPQFVALTVPFDIWATSGVTLDSEQTASYDSWAKVQFTSSASNRVDELGFSFIWTNPSDEYVVVNSDPYLQFTGYCDCGSDGGFFPGERKSRLNVRARQYVWALWNDPMTLQGLVTVSAFDIATSTGGWFDAGAIDDTYIDTGFTPTSKLLVVPPHGLVFFDVSAYFSYSSSDGFVGVDFTSSDEFRLRCPAILVFILT
jgi:hypothetical protein